MVHPQLWVLPMGLSHSVYLVQTFHEFLVRRIRGVKSSAVAREWGLPPESLDAPGLTAVIVDDLNYVSLETLAETEERLSTVEEEYLKVGWTAKAEKNQGPAMKDRRVSGVDWDGEGLEVVAPLRKLQDTLWVGCGGQGLWGSSRSCSSYSIVVYLIGPPRAVCFL
jgi:hypothetical protein